MIFSYCFYLFANLMNNNYDVLIFKYNSELPEVSFFRTFIIQFINSIFSTLFNQEINKYFRSCSFINAGIFYTSQTKQSNITMKHY